MVELSDFQAATATISTAELGGRTGEDTGATITYQANSGFELRWWFISGPRDVPTQVRQLDSEELATLLDKLNELLKSPPSTIDVEALEVFRNLVERQVVAAPGTILADVTFGQVTEEIFGGKITFTGHIGLGVDVVGTIHMAAGIVTWEHHVVPLPPGPASPLTPSEREVLKTKLEAWLRDNPGGAWKAILAAL